jgi:hypothetical protein
MAGHRGQGTSEGVDPRIQSVVAFHANDLPRFSFLDELSRFDHTGIEKWLCMPQSLTLHRSARFKQLCRVSGIQCHRFFDQDMLPASMAVFARG